MSKLYTPSGAPATGSQLSSATMRAELTAIETAMDKLANPSGHANEFVVINSAGTEQTSITAAAALTALGAPSKAEIQGNSFTWCGTAGGTADALTLTPTPAIASYTAGQEFIFRSGASPNTGATTVAVSGLATKAIQSDGSALAAGMIAADKWYRILYDGAAFQLQKYQAYDATLAALAGVATAADKVPYFTGTDTVSTTTVGSAARAVLADVVAWTDYSSTSTVVGFSSFTTKRIYYRTLGDLVFVAFNLAGTSNSTSTSFTLPYAPATGSGVRQAIVIQDNGTTSATPGRASMDAASATVSCSASMGGAAWTASGGKAVIGQLWYVKA